MSLKLPLLTKLLAAAALVCAVLASAGSAVGSRSASVELSVVPLPQSAIGSAAKPLQLSQFSGVVSNDAAANLTLDWSGWVFTKMGRVSGYMLDYGHAASGGSGITNVRTSVEQYRTSGDARVALGLLKKEDARLARHLTHGVLTVTSTRVKAPMLGKARFAYLTRYRAANIAPLATLDERILEGKYLLQAQVSAGTSVAAKTLAPKLAKKLDQRFKLALKGRLHAKPVQLPPMQTAGPPVGGPDLSLFALGPSDLGSEAKLTWAGYVVGCGCGLPSQEDSRYEVSIVRTGIPWDNPWLNHQIEWYGTANEAAFRTDRSAAHSLAHDYKAIDVRSVGHGAQGTTTTYPSGGSGVEVILNVGHLAEVLWITSVDGPIQTSEVLTLAQTAANRIDAHYTP
jgi:hypothetical protein